MGKIKKSLGLLKKTAVLAIIGLTVGVVANEVVHESLKKPAIFKIGNDGPWCTAFAISDTVAVTAAHCISDPVTLLTGVISVYEPNETPAGTAAIYMSKHPALDIAAIKGDFKNRHKLKVAIDRYELSPDDKYDSCGFPLMTNNLVCSAIKLTGILNVPGMGLTAQSGTGFMLYGMSGGPVFNRSKGLVVALNTGLIDRELILSPFIDIEKSTVAPKAGMFFRVRRGTIVTTDMITTTDMIGVQ